MRIDFINHLKRENLTEFKVKVIKRQWDVLVFVTDGEYAINYKGRQKPVVLKQNDIAFIPAGTEVERSANCPTSFYHLSFYAEADHPFYLSANGGKLTLPDEQKQAIFKSLERAYLLPTNRESLAHIIEHIFAENYLFGKTKKASFRNFSEEITSTVNYMNRNLDKKLDIDELAARVYLSHSGLIWKFRKELGTTPLQYLNMLRLRNAKQLLLNHSYSITEISEMCGYSTPYYFTNLFHKYSGMSPTEFRNYHLKKGK